MQTAFTFSEERKQGPGRKKQPSHRRATRRGHSPHPAASGCTDTHTEHRAAGQFLEHEPTSQQSPAEVYKQAPKHIIVHFSNLQSRGERLQRLLLMHGNSPTSPEEYSAGVQPRPLRGRRVNRCFLHPSAPLQRAWAGPAGQAR